jgi:hypothetical protein
MIISPHPRLNSNKIDLADPACARHWSKKLGKSKEEIAAAIVKVGDNCETVCKELGCSDKLQAVE